jgi:hypothetical protein
MINCRLKKVFNFLKKKDGKQGIEYIYDNILPSMQDNEKKEVFDYLKKMSIRKTGSKYVRACALYAIWYIMMGCSGKYPNYEYHKLGLIFCDEQKNIENIIEETCIEIMKKKRINYRIETNRLWITAIINFCMDFNLKSNTIEEFLKFIILKNSLIDKILTNKATANEKILLNMIKHGFPNVLK